MISPSPHALTTPLDTSRPTRTTLRRRVARTIAALALVPLLATIAVPALAGPVTVAADRSGSSAQTASRTTVTGTPAGAYRNSSCTVSAILVPSCGAWWGMSPGGSVAQATGVADFERQTGERTDIFHGYHQFGDMFPTASERALARDPAGKRLLLLNLMPTTGGRTWGQVAAGVQDAYLAQLATYIRTNFPEKFFVTIHHEPENDVIATAGSGMQATDYAAMFRHVVTKLRASGVSNVVFVMTYQGVQSYKLDPWWGQLYPGDDVIDWIAWDIYSCVAPAAGQPCIDYSNMMNRRYSQRTPWVGMYNWATTNHPGKPLMIPEIGVYDVGGTAKADVLRTIGQQVSQFPAIKAISYWNSGEIKKAQITVGLGAVAAAAETAQNPWFDQSP